MGRPEYPIIIQEEREIHRITFKRLLVDLSSAFNVERGLIYTLKLLFIRPSLLMDLYLHEGRFKIFNAFRLLVLTTALSLSVLYMIGAEALLSPIKQMTEIGEGQSLKQDQIEHIYLDWYNLILWTSIPIYAFFSYWFNRKQGYNYSEHLVVHTFYISIINLIFIPALLSALFIPFMTAMAIYFVSYFIYYIWMLHSWLRLRG
ncbi:MAG: DUF3667 domain-containing protein, partial [Bacteroidota bacterium]